MYWEKSMDLEQDFLRQLLQPLENQSVLTIKEYLDQLGKNGVIICNERQIIDSKFESHLQVLLNQGLISNLQGESTLSALGIMLAANGYLTIFSTVRVMKPQENNKSLPINNFNISSINASNVQVGNENTQNITINELVEQVAEYGDSEAKSTLKKLLENSTVSKIIGAAVSGLIGKL